MDIRERCKELLASACGRPWDRGTLSDRDEIFTSQALAAVRMGILAGMIEAENICRTETPTYDDPGNEFWKTPAEMADSIRLSRLEIETDAP